MLAILDTDSYVFRTTVGADDFSLEQVQEWIDQRINETLNAVGATSQILYLSGKGNFRYDAFPEYKVFRKDKIRPKWEQAIKQYLVDKWQAEVVDGMEADDACGIKQTSYQGQSIICHQDKDINQIKGRHYNFVTKELYSVSVEAADRFFWYQLLVGDPTDGIKGANGIGKVKATKLLDSLSTNQEMYEAVKDCFSCEEELEMNAQCVYIHRRLNDNWRNLIEATKC